MDREAQDSAGDRDHSGQEDGRGGEPVVRSSPSEIEGWVDDATRGMENSLRANPLDIREKYEKQLKDLQEGLWRGHAGAACAIKVSGPHGARTGTGLLAGGVTVSLA